MAEWIPTFAMPNVQLQYPIESGGIAFVSVVDYRTKALWVKYPNYDAKLIRKLIQVRVKLNPSTIVLRDDTAIPYKRVDALNVRLQVQRYLHLWRFRCLMLAIGLT